MVDRALTSGTHGLERQRCGTPRRVWWGSLRDGRWATIMSRPWPRRPRVATSLSGDGQPRASGSPSPARKPPLKNQPVSRTSSTLTADDHQRERSGHQRATHPLACCQPDCLHRQPLSCKVWSQRINEAAAAHTDPPWCEPTHGTSVEPNKVSNLSGSGEPLHTIVVHRPPGGYPHARAGGVARYRRALRPQAAAEHTDAGACPPSPAPFT
jgi:hypothetical protein